jgi:hypothetical protein
MPVPRTVPGRTRRRCPERVPPACCGTVRNRGRAVQAPGRPEGLDLTVLRWVWRYPADSGCPRRRPPTSPPQPAGHRALLEGADQPVPRPGTVRVAGRVSLREPAQDGRRGPGPSARDTPSSDVSRGEPPGDVALQTARGSHAYGSPPGEGANARFAPISQRMAAVIPARSAPRISGKNCPRPCQ